MDAVGAVSARERVANCIDECGTEKWDARAKIECRVFWRACGNQSEHIRYGGVGAVEGAGEAKIYGTGIAGFRARKAKGPICAGPNLERSRLVLLARRERRGGRLW